MQQQQQKQSGAMKSMEGGNEEIIERFVFSSLSFILIHSINLFSVHVHSFVEQLGANGAGRG
jgi:hypothetical protein